MKNEDEDDELDQYTLTIRLTHKEAGAVYAALMTILDISAPHQDQDLVAAVGRLKASQLKAIAEGVITSLTESKVKQ